jgi:hypothetical protein
MRKAAAFLRSFKRRIEVGWGLLTDKMRITMKTELLIGSRKGLFVAQGDVADASSFVIAQHHFPGEPVSQIFVSEVHGIWLVALRLGHFGVKVHASRDRGTTWNEVAAPAFPKKPEDGPWADDATNWTIDQVWSFALGVSDSGVPRMWAGAIPAGLFYSDDWGVSWKLLESLWYNERRKEWFGGGYDAAGIHSICVDPRDARHITIAISCGGVWSTRDNGVTWSLLGNGMLAPFMPEGSQDNLNVQDPHSMSQCAGHPDVMWVQHHARSYRSIDSATNWTRMTQPYEGDFGFVIVADPTNQQRAWVVPAQADAQRYAPAGSMCVARTDDGGKSWSVLREGLPQQHAYDLVYRHAMALTDQRNSAAQSTQRTLAIASTTGGVWLSSDSGERWSALPARLPPVNVVTFA